MFLLHFFCLMIHYNCTLSPWFKVYYCLFINHVHQQSHVIENNWKQLIGSFLFSPDGHSLSLISDYINWNTRNFTYINFLHGK